MKCPGCGSDVPGTAGRCPSCSTLLVSSVAIGVLTPPPSDAPVSLVSAPQSAEDEPLVTRVSAPSPAYAPTQVAGVLDVDGRRGAVDDGATAVVVGAGLRAGE